MSAEDDVVEVLLEYLHGGPAAHEAIDADTDLLESGKLDSLLVMDLVCFLESRFQMRMQPTDIDPSNLRSVRRIAEYVRAKQSFGAEAA